jgi:DNA-binding response OmpR family regulator
MDQRVLVVDDDAVLLQVFCEFLRDEGMQVDGAADLDAARAALSTHRYDVLVVDMLLGDRFGAELLSDLCDRPEAPRALALSATPSESRWAQRYRVPFISKPFMIDALLEAIAAAAPPQRTRPSGSSRVRAAFRGLPPGK